MNKNLKTATTLATLLLAAALGTGLAFALRRRPGALASASANTLVLNSAAPAVDSPEVQAALAQTRQLVDALRANDWRPSRTCASLLTLPGQARAEYPQDRDPAAFSYAIPHGNYPYENIAVFSRTYVRENIQSAVGDSRVKRPSGFYIVGWRDGRVETVPVEKVKRVIVDKSGTTALLFPGVTERQIGKDVPK